MKVKIQRWCLEKLCVGHVPIDVPVTIALTEGRRNTCFPTLSTWFLYLFAWREGTSLSGILLVGIMNGAHFPSRCQVIPVSSFTRAVRHDQGYAINELVFQAPAPPLGYASYSISKLPARNAAGSKLLKKSYNQALLGSQPFSGAIQNEVWADLNRLLCR